MVALTIYLLFLENSQARSKQLEQVSDGQIDKRKEKKVSEERTRKKERQQ